MIEWIKYNKLRLLLFGGKGGVGKTTCAVAAALGIAGSDPKRKFLLVSVDPAHSVADSLAGSALPGNLTVIELDAKAYSTAFQAAHKRELHEIAARGTFLDDEDINRLLDISLPGMDEVMAFLEISRWVEEQRYDCIIMDTAPTGHTLRLLGMPELIRKWLDMLDSLLAKHRYMARVFSGAYHNDRLDDFLEDIGGSVDRMEALLKDNTRCRFTPVMLAEDLSTSETIALTSELKNLGIAVADIIINRLYPQNTCPVCTRSHMQQMNELRRFYQHKGISDYTLWGIPLYPAEVCGRESLDKFWESADRITGMHNDCHSRENGNPGFCNNPGFPITPSGMTDDIPTEPAPRVETAIDLPSPEIRLMIFAGKGGVGKTTLACASALRLADNLVAPGFIPAQIDGGQAPALRTANQKAGQILLLSTDPAHSLSACLRMEATPKPASIHPHLSVMEIDAQTEFDSLKEEYSRELEEFLQSLSPNLDLTYDREVMEKILDFTPPGIDEIMAISKVIEFISPSSLPSSQYCSSPINRGTTSPINGGTTDGGEGRGRGIKYDLLILDSAPTGHLLRLLEFPEILDQWLKVFFGLLLKYKNVFRLPEISRRLVQLSKSLKYLRALLNDPERSAVYAVIIPTEMACQETGDLISACQRMGINVPVLFINQATPENDCTLCSALNEREIRVRRKIQRDFAGMRQTLVYRTGGLQGLSRLNELGQALYHG